MNVLNRKMFANRDARRKLANMGGILASSPELMQTAQMFAPGGRVGSPTAQKVKTVRHPQGFVYDVYTDGRVVSQITGVPLNPNDPIEASLIREVMSLPDMTTPRPVPKLETNPILNEQEIATESRSMLPIRDNRQELQDMIDSRTELVPGTNIPGPSEQYVIDKTSPNYTARDPSEIRELTSKKDLPPNPYQSDIDAAVESFVAPKLLNMGSKFKGQDKGGSTLSSDDFAVSSTKGYPYPTDKSNDKEVEIAKDADADLETAEVETAEVEKPGQRGFTPGQGDDTITALEEIATGGGTSEQKVEKIRKEVFGPDVDSKTAISKYQEQFNALLGEDRDLNEEKWHTLAMIGFAIAAGEDSNALTNIANGLLEGTKMAREDRATRQARKDKINMLALEQFFADERLRKELEGRETVAGIQAAARVPAEFEAKPTLEEAIDDAARAEMDAAKAIGQFLTYADAVKRVTPIVIELYGKKRTSDSTDNLSDEEAARKAAEEKLGLT